jgi:hypothetical protein
MRYDRRSLDTPSSPSERASSAISSVISAIALAGALGVIGSALYWLATLALEFFARGTWLALALLGSVLVFAVAWFLRSSVLGRLWFFAAFVLSIVFLAPFVQRAL